MISKRLKNQNNIINITDNNGESPAEQIFFRTFFSENGGFDDLFDMGLVLDLEMFWRISICSKKSWNFLLFDWSQKESWPLIIKSQRQDFNQQEFQNQRRQIQCGTNWIQNFLLSDFHLYFLQKFLRKFPNYQQNLQNQNQLINQLSLQTQELNKICQYFKEQKKYNTKSTPKFFLIQQNNLQFKYSLVKNFQLQNTWLQIKRDNMEDKQEQKYIDSVKISNKMIMLEGEIFLMKQQALRYVKFSFNEDIRTRVAFREIAYKSIEGFGRLYLIAKFTYKDSIVPIVHKIMFKIPMPQKQQ
ncbi:unnamed protein product [Paramecium sonneborni]|uniref:Uncharacterized protein n=1 Tax=Paramecium sonneborni TaxID=65129 RepID=A0A8S1RPT2_9CILI|nr:unnamed protein product [Paramecium sonneborni]